MLASMQSINQASINPRIRVNQFNPKGSKYPINQVRAPWIDWLIDSKSALLSSLLDGVDFQAPGLEPNQPFLRTLKSCLSRSPLFKSLDLKSESTIMAICLTGALTIPCWSFLSLIDPASTDATKGNFFLPLTAMYSHWCRQITLYVQLLLAYYKW